MPSSGAGRLIKGGSAHYRLPRVNDVSGFTQRMAEFASVRL